MKKRNFDFEKNEDNMVELIYAIILCKSFEDAVLFVGDLLTKAEVKILSRRLKIAKLLLEGNTYEFIQSTMGVGYGTIAKISIWLNQRGEGFRRIIKKLPKEIENKPWFERSNWDVIKRKYPSYFWPEILIEEIIKNSSKKQKEKLGKILKELNETMDEKSELHKKIESLLRNR